MPPNPAPSMTPNGALTEVSPTALEHKAEPEVVEVKAEEEAVDVRFGCGPVRCDAFQWLLRPGCFLFFLSLLGLFQTMVVTGYSSAVLTTIEVRYDFLGSELGLIVSSYDFASTLCGVFVSYFGDRYCRPQWLSRGAFVMCIGAALWTVPYFVSPEYDPTYSGDGNNTDHSSIYQLCNHSVDKVISSNVTSVGLGQSVLTDDDRKQCLADTGSKSNGWALPVFMGAFMIMGFGASPVWTLGPTYLYDNTPKSSYTIYAGILYSMGALGPALGFVLSAAILNIYVTPWAAPLGLDSNSPTWVGAWWIGFLVLSGLLLMISIPLMCYPKALPRCKTNISEEAQKTESGPDGRDIKTVDDDEIPVNSSLGTNIKDLPRHVWSLISNLLWLSVTMALCTEQAIGVGFSRFIAKYLQSVYSYTASDANIITGAVLIPAAALGVVSGGLLMKKLTLGVRDLTLLLLTVNFIPIALMTVPVFIDCNSMRVLKMSDFTSLTNVNGWTIEGSGPPSCHTGCSCDDAPYGPVCGPDGHTFTSACAAGCQVFHPYNQSFSSCACINATFGAQEVVPGSCPGSRKCTMAPLFLAILFLSVFITTGGQTPILLITLRSVNPKIRSFALGMQNFIVQLLVFVPAPIYFGKIFDSQCTHRKLALCDTEGACINYKKDTLRLVFMGAGVGFKVLTAFSLFLAFLAAKRLETAKKLSKQKDAQEENIITVSKQVDSRPNENKILESTRL